MTEWANTAAAKLALEIGAAVGEAVGRSGVAEVDAASVLLILAVGMLSENGYGEAETREVFEGALRIGPELMAVAVHAAEQPRGKA